MDTTTTTGARAPEVLGPGAGHHLHFLNHLATVRVVAGDDGLLSVVEFTAPRGTGAPLHRHRHEDELFLVHAGELVFHVGEDRHHVGAGGLAYLPRRSAHTFQVRSSDARFTCVTASTAGPPEFDRMVTALGAVTDAPALPEPGPIDPGRVAEVCAAHGIEILGPPPAPLD